MPSVTDRLASAQAPLATLLAGTTVDVQGAIAAGTAVGVGRGAALRAGTGRRPRTSAARDRRVRRTEPRTRGRPGGAAEVARGDRWARGTVVPAAVLQRR